MTLIILFCYNYFAPVPFEILRVIRMLETKTLAPLELITIFMILQSIVRLIWVATWTAVSPHIIRIYFTLISIPSILYGITQMTKFN